LDRLGDTVQSLSRVATRVFEITQELTKRRGEDILQWASYTFPALASISEVLMAWRLLDMAVIAIKLQESTKGSKKDFYEGKILQATFYADTVLPQSLVNMENCLRPGREILEIPDNAF
jgi:hypothetical protein